jgi:carbon monoxide dehydrogenase subunit G
VLLNNDFVVDVPADTAWTLLTDLERVATCLPGASLDGRDGEAYVGGVTVKVGPISASFRGTAQFVEQDDAAHAATITAAGKDPKGQAAANATIRARLEPDGPGRTRVLVDTDLDISGRMAQFGRGAIADVSARLMRQFADNLSAQITAGSLAPAAPAALAAASPSVTSPAAVPAPARPAPAPAPAPAGLDALSLIGPVVLKRVGPGAAALAAGVALGWALRGRRERRRHWTRRLGLR